MSEWKYLVLRKVGNFSQRQLICANIKRHVERRGISTIFPQIKYERSKQIEYYLGLAMDAGVLPDGEAERQGREILSLCVGADALNPNTCWIVAADEAKSLLTGAVGTEKIAASIKYQRRQPQETPSTENLLALEESPNRDSCKPDEAESEKYSKLLYWCSAVGSGRLDRFRDAVEILGLDQEWGGAWSILRKFVLLGHLEFDGGRNFKWAVLKPTVFSQLADDVHLILVGQRNPSILKYLADQSHVNVKMQVGGPPLCLIDKSSACPDYGRFSISENLGNAAEQLCNNLPDLDQWSQMLPKWEEIDLSRYTIEEYDPSDDSFGRRPRSAGFSPFTMYRFQIDQFKQRITTHAMYDEDQKKWICGDFYGLRFLARARNGYARCLFSKETQELYIPVEDRWPMPYERALVLAGGLLPLKLRDTNNRNMLIYTGITADFAIRMSNLLNLQMEGDLCSI
ncbi:MAG: hypothetical protein AB7V04_04930 [Desulfomonilaceae bacterium]